MSHSGFPRATELRQIDRVTSDCLDLGDDAESWQSRLIDGLRHLTGGLVAAVAPLPPADRPEMIHQFTASVVDGGWPSAAVRVATVRSLRDPAVLMEHPAAAGFFARPGAAVTCIRRELVSDRLWAGSGFVNDTLRPLGFDEGMLSRVAVPAVSGVYFACVMRPIGERPFTLREGRLAHALIGAVATHLGRRLLLTTQPNLQGLSPRHRQVLDRLLNGDSEKEAGLYLGMSRGTVHGYVKRLYLHFGVSSRAELLAYFLRRYRGSE